MAVRKIRHIGKTESGGHKLEQGVWSERVANRGCPASQSGLAMTGHDGQC